jgi:Fic family protein
MDIRHFKIGCPGRLVEIAQPRKDWAFIPAKLPQNWGFDYALWPLLVEAKEALGTLNGIGQTLADPQLLLRPLRRREAIASSKIEGTYVTPERLALFELHPSDPTSADDRRADWLEVFNYSEALEYGQKELQTMPICNRVVKGMHKILMRGVRGRTKSPGEFRTWQVQIGSTGRFIPPPASELPALMGNLEEYINKPNDQLDPLVRCFVVHYQFETIHPFGDGNGRVGRSLLALMIYQWLGHSMPWLYMSNFYEQWKDEYVDNLYRVSTQGAWAEWIEFCLRGVIAQANDAIRRCREFNRLRKDFKARLDGCSKTSRSHDIIDRLFTEPVVTIPSLVSRFKVTYHTARADVRKLMQAGILQELEDAYPKSYFSPELMQAAYDPEPPGQEQESQSAEDEDGRLKACLQSEST